MGNLAPAMTWVMLAFGASMLWGLQYAIWGQLLKVISPLAGLWWYCVFSTILYGVFLGVKGVSVEGSKLALWPVMVMLVCVAVLGFVANVGMLSGFKLSNATLVTMITASSPLFAAIFSFLLFRSVQVNLWSLAGFALILAGVGLVAWSRGN
jgi:drug/metabolite transporter (DMT)-like permease